MVGRPLRACSWMSTEYLLRGRQPGERDVGGVLGAAFPASVACPGEAAQTGILALNPGDYAIVHMQFRVGDGQEISRDWEALCRMRSFRLPAVAPWDGQSPASHELRATALLLSPPRPIGIRAFFDQDATLAYYREILEEGQRAFIESHYGVEQAEAWERTCVEGYESAKRMRLYRELNPLGFAAMVAHDQYTQSESARVSIIQDVDRETRAGRSIVRPDAAMRGAVELHRETYHTEMEACGR